MIKIENLTKRFGELVAVNNVNLHVEKGEIFGFLGPNGAGKTTTIKIMAGLLLPTSGRVLLGGYDVVREPLKAKRIVGFIPDRPFLYDRLTGREFMRFMGGLYGVDSDGLEGKIERLLEIFGLSDWKDELIQNYSHGMKQRLIIASALLHRPEIIIVDEPMVGLDPRGAKMVKELFRSMAEKQGVSIFMSTHTLEVAQQMCHRIAIINEGKVIALGTFDELKEQAGSDDGQLESIFLRLTGGEDMREVIDILAT